MKLKATTRAEMRSRQGERRDLAQRFTDQSQQVLRAVASARDVTLRDAASGHMKVGRGRAQLSIEGDAGGSDHWIRAEMPLEGDPRAEGSEQLLAGGSRLPGNARHARIGGELVLVADTRTDGIVHLPRSLNEMRYAFGRASGYGRRMRFDAVAIDGDHVSGVIDAVAEANGGAFERVEREHGWELRPRVAGSAVPVLASLGELGLRIHKSFGALLGTDPSDTQDGDLRSADISNANQLSAGAVAVATEALRLNGRLRLSRIAHVDGELVVETVLHGELIDSLWIVTAARAVAVAFTHCRGPLRVLAENDAVAKSYVQLFLEDQKRRHDRLESELQCSLRRQ